MNFIDEFRDKDTILALNQLIKKEVKFPINIMEICGGHTHSIMKFALPSILPKEINFIHGPGCPVCVMSRHRIDIALKLATMKDSIFCTLGDLLRVPGSEFSLLDLRAKGADIRALYSPLEVLKIAKENLDKNIIFFAIGFETTTPMTALLLEKIIEEKLKNVFLHINHIVVPQPIISLMSDKNAKIDAFLGPSHVSVITGYKIYEPLAKRFKTPIAVSGFEPVDIMESVLNIVRQKNNDTFEVFNQYKRAVSKNGNEKAQNLVKKYFKEVDFEFRGLGLVENGGLALKDEFSDFDASKKFNCEVQSKKENKTCICGQILKGLAKPYDCKVFSKICNPKNPIGSCMVSGEGACAAYYKYYKA
ncbi:MULTISPECIES: hydrogenase formation protein HypD [unclassified Campylobacter]|uniref:hydrogenase formation protein HypD n=1 Tax=unclassified Campylobacter TaxID=2593542 RepID=UPI00123816E8|nr:MULTISPECIES: hydrogenase formation protein HypD [unclassified Campylobacter]KAA6225442.1 hydrogenase formation protein HypD [Campylobacter sp. LR196d]KAA6228794.1 hydrogenase formation protein HypD [Campylobacter sp. LR185c]KAA6229930.1 hydrogenase formation protein HypD [Campylobacter sp. LR286c]KAA6234238.1 hydrogenase formation protein HypD [Campylobacter sp. LR291e]KAA8604153.1 hydrogenase formation protein HypD [Campylobacter sp. LR185c]